MSFPTRRLLLSDRLWQCDSFETPCSYFSLLVSGVLNQIEMRSVQWLEWNHWTNFFCCCTNQIAEDVVTLFVGLVSVGIASVVLRNVVIMGLKNGLSLDLFGAVGVVFAVLRLIPRR